MPDIKTALSTALSEWEQDDKQQENQMKQQPFFSVTNNVTRATFDYVKNNPASASGEVSRALALRGYKPSSIGSLLTQFVKKGLCTRDAQNRYSVAVPEYVPMKASKHVKQVIQKAKATRGEGIAALSAQPTQRLVWDVETVLNTMSIVQARAMYDALKKIFGG